MKKKHRYLSDKLENIPGNLSIGCHCKTYAKNTLVF